MWCKNQALKGTTIFQPQLHHMMI